MTEVTYYVALSFVMADDGPAPNEGIECMSANAAIMRADSLLRIAGNVGAVAFSRTGDPALGDFNDAVLLRAFGSVPSDLSGL